MTFKKVSLSDLDFDLPYMDEQSFRDVLRFADYLKYDAKTKRGQFRLSLSKCAALEPEEMRRLARYGIVPSEDVVREVSKLRREKIVNISLQGGDLVITGTPGVEMLLSKWVTYESKTRTYRAKPKDVWDILRTIEGSYAASVDLDLELKLAFELKRLFKLREYQVECYETWRKNGFRGVIALPTASGKTFLALQAISDLKVKTVITVPSIDLLHQWKKRLSTYLDLPHEHVGVYGGGFKEVRDVTVITYDSAYLNAEKLSGRFMLIIADEAHHAVAEEFRRIFDLSIARYRMGLTATPLRSDGQHSEYEEIIGPIIRTISEDELEEDGYIAGYSVKKLYVELPFEAMSEYQMNTSIYEDYCRRILPATIDPRKKFELCLKYAARDPKARDALRARNRARMIALSGERKVQMVGELLSKYGDKKVLIFSRYVDVVKEVSKTYLIPLIVAETSNEERKAVLEMFKNGEVTKLASGMTLEEGIDVPDAQVGIIISGSGSNREYLQRVGRLLRPKKEKALVIELVTKGTVDEQLSVRRKTFREWSSKAK